MRRTIATLRVPLRRLHLRWRRCVVGASASVVSLALACTGVDDTTAGETVASSGGGDDAGACEAATLVVEPTADRVMMDFWTGDEPESVVLSLTVSDLDCTLSAEVDRDWLVASLDTGSYVPALRLSLDERELSSGVDLARVTIRGPEGAAVTTVDVELRALVPGAEGASRHVLVIGIDGLRPDALEAADAPNLDRLFERGRATLAGSTQLTTLTKSGPGWASILTGVEATKHLVDSNDDLSEMDFAYATMPRRVEDAGLDATIIANWFGIALLTEDGLEKQTFAGNDVAVAQTAALALSGEAPSLTFLHFDQVDVAGHLHGFSPRVPQYVTAIENVDQLAGSLVDAVLERSTVAQEDWLFVVVTDHSGQDKDHGPMDAIHRTIPLAFAGPTVPHEALPRSGGSSAAANHLDVAPSVYAFLGVQVLPEWALDGVARVSAP